RSHEAEPYLKALNNLISMVLSQTSRRTFASTRDGRVGEDLILNPNPIVGPVGRLEGRYSRQIPLNPLEKKQPELAVDLGRMTGNAEAILLNSTATLLPTCRQFGL